jgi:hypothetical protein
MDTVMMIRVIAAVLAMGLLGVLVMRHRRHA